ncbi:MAG TPA: SRPBCC domain-containing protein [Planctomycetota bacterium]|nr:SRPBCC domain-containing protein [Planctomycetota bacterium]
MRPGGEWRFIMHGPNGTDYPNSSVFAEIIPLRRIVVDHLSAPEFRLVASFSERRDGTHLTFRMRFRDATVCANVRPIAVPSNEENFDRLETELASMR